MNPFDPLGLGKATVEVWRAMIAEPDKLVESQQAFADAWFELLAQNTKRLAGESAPPVVEPEGSDKRFAHPAWTENATLELVKQAYLIVTQAFLAAIDATDAEPAAKKRARFFAKQFCDAMSPSNIAWLNPQVMEETIRTGGQNLALGMRNVMDDMRENQGRVALVDTKAFTVGRNVATTKGEVVFRNRLLELIRYTPTTDTVYEKPIVIMPPWINKYYVLDLQPTNSFVKYATDAGFQTFIVSWKNPDASMAQTTFEDYVNEGALAAIDATARITGQKTINAVGYCIGGTLLSMTLAYLARRNDKRVDATTFLATLIDFREPGDVANFISADALGFIEEKMNERGFLEGREMADTFNMLRANDLIWNVAVNRYLLGKDAPAFDLLYWNDDATRMPAAMHSYYLRNMYVHNNLAKPDVLEMNGTPIDVRLVDNDTFAIASREDHIAPWRSVYQMTQLFSGDVRFTLANSGHIAGIVNPPGGKKSKYWTNPANPPDPAQWLSGATEHAGSWWNDWSTWLAERSGKRVAPPKPGDTFAPLADAPGTYVLEK